MPKARVEDLDVLSIQIKAVRSNLKLVKERLKTMGPTDVVADFGHDDPTPKPGSCRFAEYETVTVNDLHEAIKDIDKECRELQTVIDYGR